MRLGLSKRYVMWFAAVLTALFAMAIGSGLSVERSFSILKDQSHARQIVQKVNLILTQIIDAEASQRGYLLTGRARYLAPYRQSKATIDRSIADLRTETQYDSAQIAALKEVIPLIKDKMDELALTIDLYDREGQDKALEVVATDRGQQGMDDIRRLLGLIAEREEARLSALPELTDIATANMTVTATGSLGCFVLVLIGLIMLNRELLRRQQTEDDLRQSQNLLRNAEEMAKLGSWSVNPANNSSRLSDQYYRLFGLERRDVGDDLDSFRRRIPAKDLEVIRAAIARTAADHQPFDFEHAITHVDGSTRYLASSGRFIANDGGSAVIIGTSQDITARKLAETALFKEEQRLRDIIAMQFDISVATLHLDKVMNIIVSRARSLTAAAGALIEHIDGDEMVYCALEGLPPERLGMRLKRSGSLSGQCAVVGQPLVCEDTEQDKRVDKIACRKIGARSMVVVPLIHQGTTIGVLKIFSPEPRAFGERDVDTLQLMAGLLASAMAHSEAFEAKQKAEKIALEASRLKSEFLANMSHEIRTPINGILGMANLLAQTPLTPEQSDYRQDITRSADALLIIINDILDLSKIEAGKFELEMTEFDMDQVISDAGKMMSYTARQKGISFVIKSPTDMPRLYLGDYGRLRQVLLNLLSNAIKFTKVGGVELRVTEIASGLQRATFRFEVEDTGIGIPETARDRMFKDFSQGDSSTSRRFGGTGLGLAISRKLVALMGGQIGMTSVEGKGSTFWFTLPLDFGRSREIAADAPRQIETAILGGGAGRILVAEDNSVNQKVMLKTLQRFGHRVHLVENGHEVLQELDKNEYDLILMDCQMPGMDGYEATAAIRKREQGAGKRIPIIAVTANAVKGDRERCLAAGMDGYVSKPIKLDELSQALNIWLSGRRPQQAAAIDAGALESLTNADQGGGLDFFADLVTTFVQGLPERLLAVERAIATKDQAALTFTAHSLKANASLLGASTAAAICLTLETGEFAPDQGMVLVASLRSEFERAEIEWQRIIQSRSRRAA